MKSLKNLEKNITYVIMHPSKATVDFFFFFLIEIL